MSNKVPTTAVCQVCGKPIGKEEGFKVQKADEVTNKPKGEPKWFHKACLKPQ